MNKVLICCEKRWVDALLNNSPLIDNKLIKNISENYKNEILEKHNITIVSKNQFQNIEKNFDYIIIDELLYFEPTNLSSIYYFIPPIDFNIADPFITDRWPKGLLDSVHPNKVAWANSKFKNLRFLGSNIFECENQTFDLSLVLNLNNHSDNWGMYHYLARDLFRGIERKGYKLDYTFREVKKENRVGFFLKIIETLNDTELKKIKLSAHGGFFNDSNYYNDVRQFFEKENELNTFLEFEKLDKKFFSFDELNSMIAGYTSWPVNKLFMNTFSSDIAVYFETAREKEKILNTMNYLITEKTIDLLNVGKPFIHLSKNVEVFLDRFGFKNYNNEVFSEIATDKVELIKCICNMGEKEYDRMMKKLNEAVEYNCSLLNNYYTNNTFLNNIIHN